VRECDADTGSVADSVADASAYADTDAGGNADGKSVTVTGNDHDAVLVTDVYG
jgi:hypothetical protein